MNLVEVLYDYLGVSLDSVEQDLNCGYLTENIGIDGITYLWYYDGSQEAAINTSTHEIVSSEDLESIMCI